MGICKQLSTIDKVVEEEQGGGSHITLTRMELCLAGSGQARPGDLHELGRAGRSKPDPAAKNGRTVRLSVTDVNYFGPFWIMFAVAKLQPCELLRSWAIGWRDAQKICLHGG